MIVMNYEQKINDIIKTASSIVVYRDGKRQTFASGQAEFSNILNKILACFENSRIMPAFGVSLHDETLKAMQTGAWVEVVFPAQQELNDLPFTSLLFRLDNAFGINLIRRHEGKYSGRCIYLEFDAQSDLSKTLN